MKHNISLIIGVAYIAFMTGITVAMVGDMSSPPELITWTYPFQMLAFIGAPFIVGYAAGKKNKETKIREQQGH